MTDTRHIRQTFHRASGLELRSTWQSMQAYKHHCHPQLSIGAIVEGQTCCVCNGREYILQPGDLIVIPAYVPHSCNPVAGQPRSYHMLYIDTDLPLAVQVIRNATLFMYYREVVERMSPASVDRLLAALPHCMDERRRASLNQPAGSAGISFQSFQPAFPRRTCATILAAKGDADPYLQEGHGPDAWQLPQYLPRRVRQSAAACRG